MGTQMSHIRDLQLTQTELQRYEGALQRLAGSDGYKADMEAAGSRTLVGPDMAKRIMDGLRGIEDDEVIARILSIWGFAQMKNDCAD